MSSANRLKVYFFESGILTWLFIVSLYCGWTIWTLATNPNEDAVLKIRLKQFLALFTLTILTLTLEGVLRGIPFKPIEEMTIRERSQVLQGQIPPIGALMSIVLIYVLYLNMKFTRVVGLNEVFARMSATTISAAVLSALIGFTISIDSQYALHAAFQILCVTILFLSMYSVIQDPIQRQMSRIFNRYGSQLKLSLSTIESRLSGLLSLEDFEHVVVQNLHDAGRTKHLGLYLWDQSEGVFLLTSSYGEVLDKKPMTAVGRELAIEAFENNTILEIDINFDDVDHDSRSARLLAQLNADLCLPMWIESELIGWLSFTMDQLSGGFSTDEIDALQEIVNRSTMTLELVRSINRIHEQRRLASLGTMAAGLAHEIRNPLAGIKGAAQHLQQNPTASELQDFLALIVSETDRLNIVVSQFLDYSRPLQLNRQSTNINELIERITELVNADKDNANVTIDLVLDKKRHR